QKADGENEEAGLDPAGDRVVRGGCGVGCGHCDPCRLVSVGPDVAEILRARSARNPTQLTASRHVGLRADQRRDSQRNVGTALTQPTKKSGQTAPAYRPSYGGPALQIALGAPPARPCAPRRRLSLRR